MVYVSVNMSTSNMELLYYYILEIHEFNNLNNTKK